MAVCTDTKNGKFNAATLFDLGIKFIRVFGIRRKNLRYAGLGIKLLVKTIRAGASIACFEAFVFAHGKCLALGKFFNIHRR